MLESWRGEWRVGVTARGVALLRTGGWPARETRLVAAEAIPETVPGGPVPSAEALAACLDRLWAACDGGPVAAKLLLAEPWTRLWMVAPPANASRIADCEAAAAARFEALHGESAAAWQIAADWHHSQPFLAAALPREMLAALQRVAADHGRVWVDAVPSFVAAWNAGRRLLRDGAWLGVFHEQTLTLGAIEGRQLRAVRRVDWAPGATDGLPLLLEREALRLGLQPPAELQWCGEPPQGLEAGELAATRIDAGFDPADASPGLTPAARSAVALAAIGLPAGSRR